MWNQVGFVPFQYNVFDTLAFNISNENEINARMNEGDGWLEWRVCLWSPDADDKIKRCYEDLKCNNQMNDNLEINLMQD